MCMHTGCSTAVAIAYKMFQVLVQMNKLDGVSWTDRELDILSD